SPAVRPRVSTSRRWRAQRRSWRPSWRSESRPRPWSGSSRGCRSRSRWPQPWRKRWSPLTARRRGAGPSSSPLRAPARTCSATIGSVGTASPPPPERWPREPAGRGRSEGGVMRSEAVMSTRPRLRVVRPGEVAPAVARARAERSARRVLATASLSTASLTTIGLVMVLSASSVSAFAAYGSSFLFFKRQLLYAAMGSVALLGAAKLPYRAWKRAWAPMLAVSVVLLALVLHPGAGTVVGGAARWIQVGPFSLQPSELAKFAVVAAAASILAANVDRLESEPLRWMLPLFLIVGGVSLLVLLQPDLGTMTVIAATLGEGLGLLGELAVLALFGALLWAGIRIALRAPDTFGRLLAGGITAWLGLQAVVNLGAVTGIMPITGVPLPFVSFGGSSLVVSMGAVGVLLSVGRAGLPGKKTPTRARKRERW